MGLAEGVVWNGTVPPGQGWQNKRIVVMEYSLNVCIYIKFWILCTYMYVYIIYTHVYTQSTSVLSSVNLNL